MPESLIPEKQIIGSTDSFKEESSIAKKIEDAASELGMELNHEEVEFIISRLDVRSSAEALSVLREAVEYHNEDINLNQDEYKMMQLLVQGPEEFPEYSAEHYDFVVKFTTVIICDWSPYSEVRAATSMLDNEDEAAETIRMYIVGFIYANVGAVVGTFFGNRYPAISLNFLALQILIYPTGRLCERLLPKWNFTFLGLKWDLNPGPWTFKEQMLATQMMASVDGPPFAFYHITVQRSPYFYGQKWAANFGYMALLNMTATFTGYGVAGLLRGLLVYPVRCVWFEVLPLLTMNRSLTKPQTTETINGWRMTQFMFLMVFTLISFCWYWIPEFLFTGLSYFSWPTWFAPHNTKLAAVTGVYNGLGLNVMPTFDWSVIKGWGMVSPWYSTYVQYAGQCISMIVIIIIYFTKSMGTQYLPINTPGLFDNTGGHYNVSRILDKHGKLNVTGYEEYSRPYMSAAAIVKDGASFAVFPASIIYGILRYRDQLKMSLRSAWKSFRKSPEDARSLYADAFTKQLDSLPEVPEWWFLSTLVGSIALYIIMIEVFKETETPVWAIFFAIGVDLILIIPLGILYATTNTFIYFGLLLDLFVGYLIPGNANAMIITKCIASNFWEQSSNYISNQKQTHYAKISSRALFRVQYLGSLVVMFVALPLFDWQFTGIKDYCNPHQEQKFTCQFDRSVFASYVLWGSLGPDLYMKTLYPGMKYAFVVGALVPIPFYFLEKKYPNMFGRWNILILLRGATSWSPTGLYYTTGNLYIAFIFNYYIRKHYLAWWRKYNYVLYAALGTGVAWGAILVFLSTGFKHVVKIDWWGNWVHKGGPDSKGADYVGKGIERIPAKGYFGPTVGAFSYN